MGQTSSQIDQLPETPPGSEPEIEVARSPSPAASVHTTASRALARDLEESVYSSAKKPTRTFRKPSAAKSPSKTVATSAAKSQRKTRAAELRDEAKQQNTTRDSGGENTLEDTEDLEASRPPKKRKATRAVEPETANVARIAQVQIPRSSLKPDCAAAEEIVPSSVVESLTSAPAAKKRPSPRKKAKQAEPSPSETGQESATALEMAEPAQSKKKKGKKAVDLVQTEPVAGASENTQASPQAKAGAVKASRKRKRDVPEVPRDQQEEVATGTKRRRRQADSSTAAPDTVVDEALLESRLAERTLTKENLDLEPEPDESNAMSKEEVERTKAKNVLRTHLKQWEQENLVHHGKAKWKTDKDGVKYLKLPQAGQRFKKPDLTAEQQEVERLEAEARQQKIAVTSQALLRVLVKEELLAAMTPKLDTLPRNTDMHIPTPPDSGKEAAEAQALNDAEYEEELDPQEAGNRGAKEQVSDWLASQNEESPVPPEQLETQTGASKKRKRKSVFRGDDDDDFQFDGSSVAPESANSASTATKAARKEARKKRRESEAVDANLDEESEDGDEDEPPKVQKRAKSKKTKVSKDDTGSNGTRTGQSVTVKGPFTSADKELADSIFEETLHQEGLTRAELVAQIKDWKHCGTFKSDLLEAFPHRTRDSVRKFAERRFHGMERGAWTTEQDQSLRAAYTSYPGQWSQISEIVGRTGADCRDRWRIQFQHENAVTGPWSVDEEEELLTAVEESIDTIKAGIRDKSILENRDRLEALLNWTTIAAQKLHGKRTGKRCHEKYNKLKARKAKDDNATTGVGISSTTRTNQHTKTSAIEGEKKKEAEKMRIARNTVTKSFEIGDYYDAFVEIHSSFKDHSQKFHDELNVLWSIVSSKNMDSRFSFFIAPSALRRAAFEKAMEQWPENAPKMKDKLDNAPTIPAKVLVLARWLEKKYGSKLKNMARTYKPELIGLSKEELKQAKKDRKQIHVSREKGGKGLSQDVIYESEEDDEDPAGDVKMNDEARPPSDVEEEEGTTRIVPETQEEPPENENNDKDASSAASDESAPEPDGSDDLAAAVEKIDDESDIDDDFADDNDAQGDAKHKSNNASDIDDGSADENYEENDAKRKSSDASGNLDPFWDSDDERHENDESDEDAENDEDDDAEEDENAKIKQEPIDNANALYATTAHPLNRPWGAPEKEDTDPSQVESNGNQEDESTDSSSEENSDPGDESDDSDSSDDSVPAVPTSQSLTPNAQRLTAAVGSPSASMKIETPTLGSRQFLSRLSQ